MALTVKVNPNSKNLKGKLDRLLNDKSTMTACHNLLFKMMTPYVPFDTGILSQDVEITDKHVRYNQPYAHYMYEGIVYGPNIPIVQNGVVVGWYSRPGIKKSPTGRYMTYDKTHHPLATRHWDEAMMRVQGDSFTKQVGKILAARANKV